jgi:RNA polymerase sigma-70 factor, ECF subfamily
LSEVDERDDLDGARARTEEQMLIEAAVGGSAQAFERLYRIHVGKVYGLCLRMTANPATAEDCTQEAFLQAWRNLHRFQARSRFATWLHRIAVNAVLAQGRRRTDIVGRDSPVEESIDGSAAYVHAEDPGAADDLESAIRKLPTGARHVLILAGIYGYTHEETSRMLGVAVGTCKAQLHRARRLLSERLDGLDEGG